MADDRDTGSVVIPPHLNGAATVLPWCRCPVCGDAASVWQMRDDREPRFLCRRNHRGVWVANGRSDRPPPPLPSRATVKEWEERAKRRSRQ